MQFSVITALSLVASAVAVPAPVGTRLNLLKLKEAIASNYTWTVTDWKTADGCASGADCTYSESRRCFPPPPPFLTSAYQSCFFFPRWHSWLNSHPPRNRLLRQRSGMEDQHPGLQRLLLRQRARRPLHDVLRHGLGPARQGQAGTGGGGRRPRRQPHRELPVRRPQPGVSQNSLSLRDAKDGRKGFAG